MRLFPKFFSCFLCPCLVAAGLAPAALADTVSLRYGWTAGLDILVTFEGERIRFGEGKERRVLGSGSYRLTTATSDAGLVLRYSEFEMEPVDVQGMPGVDTGPGPQAQMQRLVSQLGGALPETVIGPEGYIVQFNGTAETVAAFREAFRGLTDQLPPEARPRMQEILDQIMTEEILQQRMIEEWNRDVGVWIDAELERDELYQTEAVGQVALLGNAELSSVITFQYQGPAPCEEGAAQARCVKLVMRSQIEPEALTEALHAFTERLAGQPVPKVTDLKQDQHVELITDPQTLMPRRIIIEKHNTMLVMQGGQPVRGGQSERKELRYQYR